MLQCTSEMLQLLGLAVVQNDRWGQETRCVLPPPHFASPSQLSTAAPQSALARHDHSVHHATTTLAPSGEDRHWLAGWNIVSRGRPKAPPQEDLYVAKNVFKYFKCFRGILQVFYIDVAKVDMDVAQRYVASVYSNVSSVLDVCCKCFVWMLHMFQWIYTYVTSVYSKCFICFRRMLQTYVINVSPVSEVCCRSASCCNISRRRKRTHVDAFPSGAREAKWVWVVPTCMHAKRQTRARSSMRGRRNIGQAQQHARRAQQARPSGRLSSGHADTCKDRYSLRTAISVSLIFREVKYL
jgi:hypothetical protein